VRGEAEVGDHGAIYGVWGRGRSIDFARARAVPFLPGISFF